MAGTVLVTGATGYVGGRLLHELERRGVPVRCLARNPDALRGRVSPSTQIVRGDVLDPASLRTALAGVETAYYLVHSMGAPADFADLDRAAARTFGEAARDVGVRRMIYLGGLGESSAALSSHLRSRHETGEVLRASGVPVVEFRAAIIIGSGSLSFEMIRSLTERLPVMICPRWVAIKTQPIAIEDVLAYLIDAMQLPHDVSRVIEIGGPDVVSYGDIMREYASQRGLRRLLIPVPLLTPRLSSLWLTLVTPLYARVGSKLIGSIRNATVVGDPSALQTFRVKPRGLREAIARALSSGDSPAGVGRWSDSRSAGLVPAIAPRPQVALLVDRREVVVPVPASAAFVPIQRIGGERGWYAANVLWRLRGWIDLLVGGVGMRRGRRHPEALASGDPLDFWRVETFEPGRLLRLEAEMKLPGRAWLEFAVEPLGESQTRILQTARFEPSGWLGRLYWYVLIPVHAVVFARMIRAIAAEASKGSAGGGLVGRP